MINYKDKEIHLACGVTDMRKSINGLMLLVEYSFKLNPLSGALFMFCNKSKDKLKILEWDGTGFWLHYKRLETGRFNWPKSGKESTMALTEKELEYLLEVPKLQMKMKRIKFQNVS